MARHFARIVDKSGYLRHRFIYSANSSQRYRPFLNKLPNSENDVVGRVF
ncbi:MAG: hypothetical protein AAB469_00305 [Patescibacteria group bacterium]